MTSEPGTPGLQSRSSAWHPVLAVAGFCGWSVVIISAVRELAIAHDAIFRALRVDDVGALVQGMFSVLFVVGSMAAWVAGTSLLLSGLRFLFGKPMRYREDAVDERAFFGFYLACAVFLTTAAHQWMLWTILLPLTGGVIDAVSVYAARRARIAFLRSGLKAHARRVVDHEIVHVLGPASVTEANVRVGAGNEIHPMPYDVLATSPRPAVPADDLPISPADSLPREDKPSWHGLTGDLAYELGLLLAAEADLAGRVGTAPDAVRSVVPALSRCDEILRQVDVKVAAVEADIVGWPQWLERASQVIATWLARLRPPMTSDDLTYSQGQALGAIRKALSPHVATSDRAGGGLDA